MYKRQQEDLSRLGRNYILTGQYTELYIPSKGVRYFAINDNVDTINGDSELAPFLTNLHEMHAPQTSKKVKAAMHPRFANGAHYGAYAPLGYVQDPVSYTHLAFGAPMQGNTAGMGQENGFWGERQQPLSHAGFPTAREPFRVSEIY